MPFDRIKRKLQIPDLETIEALSEPSIMDEYIKRTDPEQYEDIEQAINSKIALDSVGGIGGTMGIVKGIAPEAIQLEKWLKLRQETDPNFGRMEQIIKDTPAIDPNFQRLTPEEIEKLRGYANTPFDKEALFEKLRQKLGQ